MSIWKATDLARGDIVTRVLADPETPHAEILLSGEVVRVRRLIPGWTTVDIARGTLTLSDTATVELDDTEDPDPDCPDCGADTHLLVGGSRCTECDWSERE